jgi:hypothetical protein
MDPEIEKALEEASTNETAEKARREVCEAVAAALQGVGGLLLLGGSLIGDERVQGESPFGFGSDAVVGLSTVAQIGGELLSGGVLLLKEGNRYAAAALLRQVVEVEYLAWAFAEDQNEAKAWLRSTKEERQRFWQPRHLREHAGGRFRGSDYGEHCGKGGHPSPEGAVLLPGHKHPIASAGIWWCDMAMHGLSIWRYTTDAAQKLGYGEEVGKLEEVQAVTSTERNWREGDELLKLHAALKARLPDEPRHLAGWRPPPREL